MPFKISSAVLCDFIRTENTGKHILIGVYARTVEFTSFPQVFAATTYIELEVERGPIDLEFKVDFPGQKKEKIATRPLASAEGPVSIIMGIAPFEIIGPGLLRLRMRARGARRWIQVLTKEIKLRSSDPTASPTPSERSPRADPDSSS